MPSEFETDFVEGAADLMTQYGRTATYTPPSGSAVTGIKVRVDEDPTMPHMGSDHVRSMPRKAKLKVLSAAIAVPVQHGRFTIEGDTWTIVGRPALRHGQWTMDAECTRVDRIADRRAERA